MEAIEPNIQGLLVFLLLWTSLCFAFFFLIGHLPVNAAPDSVRSGAGPVLIWVNVVLGIVLLAGTLGYGLQELRWTSLIVTGGFVFLFAPLLVQDMPPRLRDTQLGLGLLFLVLLGGGAVLYVFY